jgi:hypothetical protein
MKAADLVDFNGETMKHWDMIRQQCLDYKGSDLPRLNFEGMMEDHCELMVEAADAIRRMKLREGESINDWARRLGSEIAAFTG